MLWDVLTCWNLTYDMLKFILDYCIVLDVITGKRDMKLWKYELKDTKWHIVGKLQDILEVCSHLKLFQVY